MKKIIRGFLTKEQNKFLKQQEDYTKKQQGDYYYLIRKEAKKAMQELALLASKLPEEQQLQIFTEKEVLSMIEGILKPKMKIFEWRGKIKEKPALEITTLDDLFTAVQDDERRFRILVVLKEFVNKMLLYQVLTAELTHKRRKVELTHKGKKVGEVVILEPSEKPLIWWEKEPSKEEYVIIEPVDFKEQRVIFAVTRLEDYFKSYGVWAKTKIERFLPSDVERRVLNQCMWEERSMEDLKKLLDRSYPTVQKVVKRLIRHGMLERIRRGRKIRYKSTKAWFTFRIEEEILP